MDEGDAKLLAERRLCDERRTWSWQTVWYSLLLTRRQTSRRLVDADCAFSDWHHPWLLFLSLGIMLLSCVDAFMTQRLIERGMQEVNPVMSAMLGLGYDAFVHSKLAMTGISLILLVLLARVRLLNRLRTGLLLTLFFSAYCCLVCYQTVSLLQTM